MILSPSSPTKACRPPPPQERERLVLQAQHLQAQLAKQAEEARESNLRMAQLVAQLEEKTQTLEAAQVGSCFGCGYELGRLVARQTRACGARIRVSMR